jgi:NitT/TauT family transport system substrate-binding protein
MAVMRLVISLVLTSLLWASPGYAASGLVSVDVALGDVSINKVPFLMAADNGIYERNGLDIHQFVTPNAAEVARNSGVIVPPETVREDIDSAPIAVGGGSPTICRAVHTGGIDRVVLATQEGIVKSHIIGAPSIRRIEDVRGKRLGYSSTGTVTHVGLLSFARHMGWDPGTDIILVDRSNTIGAITGGRVDATMASAMLVALAPEAGLNDVVDLEQFNMPLAGSGVMAERAWLAANRDIAARFVKSAVEAVALMKQDRAAFDASLTKWFNITDAVTQTRMYAVVMDFPNKPCPSVEGISAMMEIYDSPQMRAHTAEEFYDSSFIETLDESGFLDALYE